MFHPKYFLVAIMILLLTFTACKKKGGTPIGNSDCTTSTLIFPQTGLFGPNLLHDSVVNVYTHTGTSDVQKYSLRAEKECESVLKIKVQEHVELGHGLEWYYTLSTETYVVIAGDLSINERTFVLERETIGEAQLHFFGEGQIKITYMLDDEVFEEKILNVNP